MLTTSPFKYSVYCNLTLADLRHGAADNLHGRALCDSHSTSHHEIVLSDIVVTAFTSFTIRSLANNVYNYFFFHPKSLD